MSTVLLLLWVSLLPVPQDPTGQADNLAKLISDVTKSGRVLTLVPTLDDNIRITPGAPPLLAFRYLEGRQRGRFGGLDLVLDDAGH
jgi:hypothetical protein